MKAYICSSNASALVNGCPTQQFEANRGLKQRNPLGPFIFLVVVEGLATLFRSVVGRDVFKSLQVWEDIQLLLLQYANDFVVVMEVDYDILWAIKSIFRSFELLLGLKVNFYKSNFYRVRVDDQFLLAVESFLHWKKAKLLFKFLGLPIGANPRLVRTCDSIIQYFKKKLALWKRKHVSIGGRAVLTNSILGSSP